MALSRSQPVFTIEEYLEIERGSLERHEFLDGQIFDMAGESLDHGTITMNLSMVLATQLKGTDCQAFSKDIKVRSGPVPKDKHSRSGLYSYPDLVVLCGTPEFHDDHRDVIINPTVILEVLSPSTEAFDRGEKFRRYHTWNPTLKDYLLVLQDRPQIDHYERQDNGAWSFTMNIGLDKRVAIDSISCQLNLTDIYDRVKFEMESD